MICFSFLFLFTPTLLNTSFEEKCLTTAFCLKERNIPKELVHKCLDEAHPFYKLKKALATKNIVSLAFPGKFFPTFLAYHNDMLYCQDYRSYKPHEIQYRDHCGPAVIKNNSLPICIEKIMNFASSPSIRLNSFQITANQILMRPVTRNYYWPINLNTFQPEENIKNKLKIKKINATTFKSLINDEIIKIAIQEQCFKISYTNQHKQKKIIRIAHQYNNINFQLPYTSMLNETQESIDYKNKDFAKKYPLQRISFSPHFITMVLTLVTKDNNCGILYLIIPKDSFLEKPTCVAAVTIALPIDHETEHEIYKKDRLKKEEENKQMIQRIKNKEERIKKRNNYFKRFLICIITLPALYFIYQYYQNYCYKY